MSWERRGKRRYYYRVCHGPQGRLTKTYFGRGLAAQRAYQEDLQQRSRREAARRATDHAQPIETQLTQLTRLT